MITLNILKRFSVIDRDNLLIASLRILSLRALSLRVLSLRALSWRALSWRALSGYSKEYFLRNVYEKCLQEVYSRMSPQSRF